MPSFRDKDKLPNEMMDSFEKSLFSLLHVAPESIDFT